MCKKLTKMAKESEGMREELAKYRSLYGDLDVSLSVEEVADSPHSREAEVKVHLKLVEEEANLLSRRIVELEVENRGLRAEMDDMKCQELPGGAGPLALGGGVATGDSTVELQRHLQFVEEEAELLRRSLLEMEEQNKLLMNELNRHKSEQEPEGDLVVDEDAGDGCTGGEPPQEELRNARLQISELSGKVKKLQYENRVLLSNLQRCDLASYSRLAMETDAEAGDSAECVPCQQRREGPVGGESGTPAEQEKTAAEGRRGGQVEATLQGLKLKDYEALLAVRDQAHLVTTAIQLLTASGPNEPADPEKNQDLPLMEALNGRLGMLQTQLLSFIDRVEELRARESVEGPLLESGNTEDQGKSREATGEWKVRTFRTPAFCFDFLRSLNSPLLCDIFLFILLLYIPSQSSLTPTHLKFPEPGAC